MKDICKICGKERDEPNKHTGKELMKDYCDSCLVVEVYMPYSPKRTT
jgi:hypothetical protein